LLALARRVSVEALFVECRCPREVAMARLEHRVDGQSVSDARADLYDAFVARYEPFRELAPAEHLVVDTDRALDMSVAKVLERLP
jgi:predicted kinase